MLIYFSPITDTEPTEKDLQMFVAENIAGFPALGSMLGIKFSKIKMFQNEPTKTISITMKILTAWIKSETRMPTTWCTLLQALRDMEENSWAREITSILERRALGKWLLCTVLGTLFCIRIVESECIILYVMGPAWLMPGKAVS